MGACDGATQWRRSSNILQLPRFPASAIFLDSASHQVAERTFALVNVWKFKLCQQ
jgi:hypothetical protein